jgi:hypothetical protein
MSKIHYYGRLMDREESHHYGQGELAKLEGSLLKRSDMEKVSSTTRTMEDQRL